MNGEVLKKENNNVEFKFEIPVEDFNKSVNQVYKRNRQYFNIPGFREGKAPRQIVEMTYGKDIFYEDAVNDILPDAFEKAVEELDLHPVSTPEIDIEEIVKGEPILVTVKVDVKPEVKLADYENLEVEKVEYPVTEELIDEEIEKVREMNARLVDASDRAVKEGDTVTINYTGLLNGEAFEGGTGENHQLEIGSNSFIEGFEEGLIGKKVDDEISLDLTFPEDYPAEELKGQDVVFEVELLEISEKELPKLDDEFAIDISEFDTLDEYKADLRNRLEKENKEKEENEQEQAMIKAVVEASEVDIPEGMIDFEIENEIKQMEQQMTMQGLNFEQFFQITGTNMENLKADMRDSTKEKIKTDLVLEAIAEKENFESTEEERKAQLEEIAESYPEEERENFLKNMEDSDLTFLDPAIINEKVVKFLEDTIKIK